MNAKKQKELEIENGQLKIRNRALEDQLAMADKELSDRTIHLAVVCYAFKKYIKATSAPTFETLTDDQLTAKLNSLIKDAMQEINDGIIAREK